MSGVLLLAAPGIGEQIVVQRRRLRDRLAARLCAGALDRELARGAAPDAHAALALRAQALIGPSARRALARQVQCLVDRARYGRMRVPSRAGEVLDAADALGVLAARLLEPEPVSARGVAQVRLLLGAGAGGGLRDAAARAIDALDVDL